MQAEITVLSRRGAAVMRKVGTVTAERIRFGRGTDNEVPLADLRVALSEAALEERAGRLFIAALGDEQVRVNGEITAAAPVGPGDEIRIGPYRVVLAPPPAGLDAALSVELVEPLGDALHRLTATSRIGLEATRLNKRIASWVLFLVVALLGLALPIAIYSLGHGVKPGGVHRAGGGSRFLMTAWNPGQLSNPHRFFASRCSACHQAAWAAVPDAACLACHGAIGAHVAAAAAGDLGPVHARLAATRCTGCHEEHRGLDGLVIREAALCVDCHKGLAEAAPAAAIRDVSGFPAGHPQFRATLVRDAATRGLARAPLATDPAPIDHPNLVFSHAAHLVAEGFPALGYKPMVCADCHVAEPGGEGFLPITYQRQCRSCHALKFDAELPWKEVPHGNERRVQAEVEGFYAARAVSGALSEPAAPEFRRALPGTTAPAAEAQPLTQRGLVKRRTEEALRIIFDPKRGCFYCHLADPARGPFRVAPVLLQSRFLLPARFDHRSHASIGCENCHNARHSASSGDILVPAIAKCAGCHGTETAGGMVRTTCLSCHVFHRPELGPMRKLASAEQRE